MKKETKDFIIEYDNSYGIKEKIFRKLLEFYLDQEAFTGESMTQSDECQIESVNLLADIADYLFKFKIEWK